MWLCRALGVWLGRGHRATGCSPDGEVIAPPGLPQQEPPSPHHHMLHSLRSDGPNPTAAWVPSSCGPLRPPGWAGCAAQPAGPSGRTRPRWDFAGTTRSLPLSLAPHPQPLVGSGAACRYRCSRGAQPRKEGPVSVNASPHSPLPARGREMQTQWEGEPLDIGSLHPSLCSSPRGSVTPG